jgi:hypothetical protein
LFSRRPRRSSRGRFRPAFFVTFLAFFLVAFVHESNYSPCVRLEDYSTGLEKKKNGSEMNRLCPK